MNPEDIKNHYRELVKCIPDKWAADYLAWKSIGQSLYNLYKGTEEGLNVWLEFSAKCPEKFDKELSRKVWSDMKSDYRITIDTLIFYAGKIDEY